MLNRNENRQMKMCLVTLDELMPQEHFLRDLDRCVDFSFIYDKVEALYSNTGRPSVDPVMLIKMMLIGYLYGIESERRLEQEVRVNIAYRWFLEIELDEPVPDHSTISQLRHRKFSGTTIFQDIFDEIVRKCMEEGLVTGKLLLTDSTHIRANARNDLREVIEVPDTPSEYMQKLDREAFEMGLIKEPVVYPEKKKSVTKSITDPDSGLLNRPGKPNAFCYLNHQTTDAENGIITDVFVTPANVNDCSPHTERLEHQIDKFGFETESVCADAGYDNAEVYDTMLKRNIKTYIPRRQKPVVNCNYEEDFNPGNFQYDSNKNVYICPAGKELHYRSYLKQKGYKRYVAKKKDCMSCPYKEQCIGKSNNPRKIERNMHEEARREQAKNNGTTEYYEAMRLRKIWCEGNFSHQKERHNLKRTFKRGIEKITEQCLLSACALNLKRLVKAM
ncbi:MAG: transposase [Ruminococcus sp.]|nr:transposase [Ruminococcus sp.]